jgi:16S rRNA (uracil1498-N3)-methyltransferase
VSQLQRLAIAPEQLFNHQICLTEAQQHYLNRVLRLRSGDRFIAMDGQGHWWLAVLSASPERASVLEAIECQTELPIAVTLLAAMPKGSGMEEIVRQTTELGVTMIIPIISDRTLLKPSSQKCDRWRRIAQEAAEQSERQIIPTIPDPLPWLDALAQTPPANAIRYLCTARSNPPHLLTYLQHTLLPVLSPPSSPPPLLIATGPEGGWTDAEIEQAIAAGYQPISLGQRILRAVTAPVVALSLIAAVLEMDESAIKKKYLNS